MKEVKKDIFKALKLSISVFACLLVLSLGLLIFGIKFAENFIIQLLLITFFCVNLFVFKTIDFNLHLKNKKVFIFLTVICSIGIICLFLGLATIDYVLINRMISTEFCSILAGLFSVAVLTKFTLHNKRLKKENQLIYETEN